MKRRPLKVLTALTLTPFVAVAALWVRSYVRPDSLHRERTDRTRTVYREQYPTSADGSVWLFWEWRWKPVRPQDRAFFEACEERQRRRGWHGWERLPGLSLLAPVPLTAWEKLGFFHHRTVSKPATRGMTGIPYWSLAAVALAPPAWPVLARARRARRRRRNLCPECGYDLRASPGRCPECGQGLAAGGG